MEKIENVKNNLEITEKRLRIAYSICGEGHGHYGRNVEIIKSLSKKFQNCTIDLYLYGDTYNIFRQDKELPENVTINEIPGVRFIYKDTGITRSMHSTFTNKSNVKIVFEILKFDFYHTSIFPFRKLWAILRNKKDVIKNRYFMKYFHPFDFAISDFELLLPRVADVSRRPFLTLDNQHAMLYCKIESKPFSLKERCEHFFIKNILKIYNPTRDLSLITCFYPLPLRDKYKKKVKIVGPIIRENIVKLKNKTEYKDFILIYAHKVLRNTLFPLLTKLKSYKFVIFTTDNFDADDFPYRRPWMKFNKIDPYRFIKYLIKCKAVISTAGNTLISEAIYLQKPFFGISLEGNFEQTLNLYMLQKSTWGDGIKISNFSEEKLIHFLNNIEGYQQKLQYADIKNDTDKMVSLIIDKIKKDLKMQ